MDLNKAIGLAMLLTSGINVMVLRQLGEKVPPMQRLMLPMFAIVFGLLGLASLFGIVKLVQ